MVAPAPEGMEGLLTVAAKCNGSSALDACIVLLALAVKGCLQGAEGVGPLVVRSEMRDMLAWDRKLREIDCDL